MDQNGKVTAVKAGSATVTVKTTDGGKSASCAVTVNAKVFPVTGVTLNKDTMTLTEGETGTLTATVAPDNASDKSVTWSSSAPDVATVDQNGKVTAVKKGTATITVKTTDGGKTAACEVTVHPLPIVIYAFNKTGWEPLNLYAWQESGGSMEMPGVRATETVVINGITYNKYALPESFDSGSIGLYFLMPGGPRTPDGYFTATAGEAYYFQVRAYGIDPIADPESFDPSTTAGNEGYGSGDNYGENNF